MNPIPKPTKREKRTPKPLRRSRPRRQRKSPIAKLRRAADKLIGETVRARGVCQAAHVVIKKGCSGPLQWCHGFSRRYMWVRWDLRNGFCMCAGHHSYFTNRPSEWEQFMQQALGMAVYLDLQAKRGWIKPMKADELRAIIDSELKQLAEGLNTYCISKPEA